MRLLRSAHVFQLERNLWVTRLRQRDAICLTDSAKRIDIALESPHDGVVRGRDIYFTLVDGRLALANSATLSIDRVIDFKAMHDSNALLGWCRGEAAGRRAAALGGLFAHRQDAISGQRSLGQARFQRRYD